jgi:hypothetical protein
MMDVERELARVRSAVCAEQYRISDHAREEMEDDDLTAGDVENAILTGRVTRRYTRDPRGIRWEVTGRTTDGRLASVVCRFLPSGVLLVITAYTL